MNIKSLEKIVTMLFNRWFPIIFTLIIIFIFPPVAIAIIAAYFTAPILIAFHRVLKIPLTFATLLVILMISSVFLTFFYIGLYGIIEVIPIIEVHLQPFTNSTDLVGKSLAFLQEKVIQYGHAFIEYAFTFIQSIFQQLISLFIFIFAYFFALRESGKNRFWFLIYFPKKLRKQAKHTLSKASELIGTFISVEAKLIFLTFIILSIGFFVLKFDSPIAVALIIAVTDSLPFLGIGIFLLPMIAFFLYGGNLFIGLSLICIYILTFTTRKIAESYLWASTFELKPVHAFIIVACSVYLFGIVGILLTPFLLFAALKIKEHPLFNEL